MSVLSYCLLGLVGALSLTAIALFIATKCKNKKEISKVNEDVEIVDTKND